MIQRIEEIDVPTEWKKNKVTLQYHRKFMGCIESETSRQKSFLNWKE